MFPYQKYKFYDRGPVLLKLNERLQAENFQACFLKGRNYITALISVSATKVPNSLPQYDTLGHNFITNKIKMNLVSIRNILI